MTQTQTENRAAMVKWPDPLQGIETEPAAFWVEVTPEIARDWLDRNVANRPLRPKTLSQYADDMYGGDWLPTHQGIAFGCVGELLDGQHRLAAIVKSGKACIMQVTPDLSSHVMLAIDRGAQRLVHDSLRLAGETGITRQHVEIARVMYQPHNQCVALTASQIKHYMDKHASAIAFTWDVCCYKRARVRGLALASIKGVIARAYYHANTNDVRRFYDILYTGEYTQPRDSTIRRLRDKLLIDSGGRRGHDRTVVHRVVERAIRAYLDGVILTKLFAAQKELFPLPDEK